MIDASPTVVSSPPNPSGIKPRIGVTPPFFAGPGAISANVQMARWAESAGVEDLWLADAGSVDALTLAAIVLGNTERIRVGIAVAPVYTRTPAVLAATVATLADLAPGRFVLGLGSSSEAMIEGWHGMPLARPLTRIRETLHLLDTMLAGEKTDFQGEVLRSSGYRQPAPAAPVPVMLAALRPKMVRLAATAADGVILNLFPLGALRRILAGVTEGLACAGRDPSTFEVGSRFQVEVTDDPEPARDAFRWRFTPYYANPVYNQFLAWAGHAAEAAAIRAAWLAGDRAAARAALTDELIDQVAIIGDAEHCRARLRTLIAAGITTPMLYCPSEDPEVVRMTLGALAADPVVST